MKKDHFINKMLNSKYLYDCLPNEFNTHKEKVCIICPEHGEFWQTPHNHLQGQGCPKCKNDKISNNLKLTTEEFIEKAKKVHGNKYDYSKSYYKGILEKVCIICPEHGEFWQTPQQHYKCGCNKCIRTNLMKNFSNTFIEKSKKIHGDKYDYSKIEYKGMFEKVCIICPEHGEFWQTPANHLHDRQGCPKCFWGVINTKSFIEKSKEIHGDKYDYSKVEYCSTHKKVCMICPEHGEFWQTPNHHLRGCGCPICKESNLESKIESFLIENKIKYEAQKRFKWLGRQSLDFYLSDYNIAIECQGEQHFKPVKYFGGVDRYIDTINRDLKKKNICNENVEIVYIFDNKFKKYIHNNEILKEIYNNSKIVFSNDLYCFWKE